MRLTAITLILLSFPFFAVGQTYQDSLLDIWENSSLDDTIRFNAIQQVVKPHLYKRPDSAFYYSELAYKSAKDKDLEKEMAQALFSMGIASKNTSDFSKALKFLNRSLEINEGIADKDGIAQSLKELGNVYLKQSNYVKAIDYYRHSLKLYEEIENEKGIGSLKNNIGLIYYDLKDYDKSLEYLNQALAISRKLGAVRAEANNLINIGSVYRFKGEYNRALDFYNQSLVLKKENNITHGMGICYSNIGLIHKALGHNMEALNYFKQSMQMHQEVGNKKQIANCLIYFAGIYESINVDSTIIFANQALNIASATENNEEKMNAAKILFRAYETKGNFAKALQMNKLYQNTKDSIFGIKKQKAVFASELKYLEEKKAIESKLAYEKLLEENRSKNHRIPYVFMGLFALISTYLGFFFKRKYDQSIVEKKDLLNKIELLKEKLATQSVISTGKRRALALDKEKIEVSIGTKLGESAWMILNVIFKNPSISNKEISKEVSLSLEGVSSSLRRMYTSFDIQSASSNKKIGLIMKAIRISMEE